MTTERQKTWVATMHGGAELDDLVLAHASEPPKLVAHLVGRDEREALEAQVLSEGATLAHGAGDRRLEEEPDPLRTCFEKDRDRILHSTSFRRLAGKTQVFVFPDDHQRTRLTHALEVAQVATAIARATGLNVTLTEAIALGHDCGHGPGGHASEDAFEPFIEGGFHHALWGADVALRHLNLCRETLDGIRHHSWSLPTPLTPEGVVVSWADRCAYSAHDLEDAVSAGIVRVEDLPEMVVQSLGRTRSSQLNVLITALVDSISQLGVIGMDRPHAEALAALRAFNYERIYMRPASQAQSDAVIRLLTALVEHFIEHPERLPDAEIAEHDPVRAAVTYVAGMTDRFAFDTAISELDWPLSALPIGIDLPRTPLS
jgi:dGTPase